MGDTRSVVMDDEQRAEFLQSGGTGVLSFGEDRDEAPYSLPVSYGYDSGSGHFFFRLLVGEEREKREQIEDGRPVSFVTYADTDDGWQSVVAAGSLERIDDENVDPETLDELRRVHIPIVDVYDRHPRELTFEFFRLDPEEIDGRTETVRED
ncbi:hypothetical protein SAMN04488063_2060 [Halopelagius inordinatus]|uniref:Pyridoxamine 5'-phosphate oxidase n=2 Tax=Halopelagius inordinatus TaxID=553467 RepID=A0A1I2RXG0_9EURY|nr:hypothetical protein SAMN04488063_2060 [Halopelagius inordinatus]